MDLFLECLLEFGTYRPGGKIAQSPNVSLKKAAMAWDNFLETRMSPFLPQSRESAESKPGLASSPSGMLGRVDFPCSLEIIPLPAYPGAPTSPGASEEDHIIINYYFKKKCLREKLWIINSW